MDKDKYLALGEERIEWNAGDKMPVSIFSEKNSLYPTATHVDFDTEVFEGNLGVPDGGEITIFYYREKSELEILEDQRDALNKQIVGMNLKVSKLKEEIKNLKI